MTERTWKEHGKKQHYQTSVRLFVVPEITHLLEEAGFTVKQLWGDFDLSPYTEKSRRIILLSVKE